MTTPFDNPLAELAWMFLQCLCEGQDPDEGFALLSDDFTYWNTLTRATLDKAALRREMQRRAQHAEITLDLIRCINDGATVVIEAQSDMVAADKGRDQIPYVFLFETHDGLITSLREYSDTRAQAQLFGIPDTG